MNTGVILPAYNVARHLADLVSAIQKVQPQVSILVVDDGSSDDTYKVASGLAVQVEQHDVNRGKGAALQTGFAWALAKELDYVFTMDADGQHLPAEMQAFLDHCIATQADVVVGTRMAQTGEMPWLRRYTNRFTSWVVGHLAGCKIPDSQNGFRLFRVSCLKGLKMVSNRFDFESEILVRLGRQSAIIEAVPISSVYADERSSINPFIDTCRFFRLVFHLALIGDNSDRGNK